LPIRCCFHCFFSPTALVCRFQRRCLLVRQRTPPCVALYNVGGRDMGKPTWDHSYKWREGAC
jgi:hypothetical protein